MSKTRSRPENLICGNQFVQINQRVLTNDCIDWFSDETVGV